MTLRRTDDVVRFLAGVAAAADRGDRPAPFGIFARTYHRMTLEMIVAVSDGSFADPPAMSAFIAAFADKYRRALEEPPPAGPWRVAFDAADPYRVIRSLLTGINAHMAYDLVLTLVEDSGVDRARRADYDVVNRVLARAIDPVQCILQEHYGAWLRTADALGRRVDEVLSIDNFTKTRNRAWLDAERIVAGTYTRQALEARVARRGRALGLLLPF